jgi:uncharacterized protein YprB with RNaseH-like and TPR domain
MKNNIHNLETLLKDILPKEKKLKESEITSNKDIHDLMEGTYLTGEKKVFCYESDFPLGKSFGNLNIDKFDLSPMITKYAGIKKNSIEDLLFIDLETTGLAGGTGTYAFLVGIGFFKENNFHIKQFFMTDLSREDILLNVMKREFSGFKTFVSFNGKCFDIPLLNTRFIFNRFDFDIKLIDHIDLLHLSRRLWRNLIDGCSLQNLERCILEKNRDLSLDIPGCEIPGVYFDYLDTKDASIIENVLYHNRIDIISMTALLQKISNILKEKFIRKSKEKIDKAGIGKLFEDLDEFENAIELYESDLGKIDKNPICSRRLSYLYKKLGKLNKAKKLWLEAAEENEEYACIELAKLAEHTEKNLISALDWTNRAIDSLNQSCWVNNNKLEELQYRKNRLLRKLNNEKSITDFC